MGIFTFTYFVYVLFVWRKWRWIYRLKLCSHQTATNCNAKSGFCPKIDCIPIYKWNRFRFSLIDETQVTCTVIFALPSNCMVRPHLVNGLIGNWYRASFLIWVSKIMNKITHVRLDLTHTRRVRWTTNLNIYALIFFKLSVSISCSLFIGHMYFHCEDSCNLPTLWLFKSGLKVTVRN